MVYMQQIVVEKKIKNRTISQTKSKGNGNEGGVVMKNERSHNGKRHPRTFDLRMDLS